MISEYERMEQLAYENNILLFTRSMHHKISGFFYSNSASDIVAITINANLRTTAQRTCALAEEIEHYFNTPCDLMWAPQPLQDKYEYKAKFAASKRLIPFDKLIKAKRAGIQNRFELAEYLGVTEEFLDQAIELYRQHYGLEISYKGYIIQLTPLDVKPA